MEKIFLFTDYRDQFYSSTKYRGAAVDLERLRTYFSALGFELIVQPFTKINFREQDYRDSWVLYQSSEDPGLLYRSYIDDEVFGLYMQGAKLIPSLPYFRAHHDKNFLEILRDIHPLSEIKNISSFRYGTYEDYLKDLPSFKEGSYVLKGSSTSKSRDVALLKTMRDKTRIPEKISRSPSWQNFCYFLERLKSGIKPLPISNNRNKFIVQTFIDGLDGDYRIVVYGDKYYVLYRANRKNDFRASGSMKFKNDIEVPPGLLNFSKKVFEGFETPYVALDVGIKNGEFFLLEFQFLSFGQYTLEKSKYFYKKIEGEWKKIAETPDLEREIACSVVGYINKQKTKLCAA